MDNPTHLNSASDRLMWARFNIAKFKNPRQAAIKNKFIEQTYYKHEKGERGFDLETAIQYADAYNVNVNWLYYGAGSPHDPPSLPYPHQHAAPTEPPPLATLNSVLIKPLNMRLGAGGSCVCDDDEDLHDAFAPPPKPVDRADIEGRYIGKIEELRTMLIKGDSMHPTLSDGDTAVVDTASTSPSPAGVFALWDGTGYVAKRIEIIPSSVTPRLQISSDDKRTPPYEVPLSEVRIIGRIIAHSGGVR